MEKITVVLLINSVLRSEPPATSALGARYITHLKADMERQGCAKYKTVESLLSDLRTIVTTTELANVTNKGDDKPRALNMGAGSSNSGSGGGSSSATASSSKGKGQDDKCTLHPNGSHKLSECNTLRAMFQGAISQPAKEWKSNKSPRGNKVESNSSKDNGRKRKSSKNSRSNSNKRKFKANRAVDFHEGDSSNNSSEAAQSDDNDGDIVTPAAAANKRASSTHRDKTVDPASDFMKEVGKVLQHYLDTSPSDEFFAPPIPTSTHRCTRPSSASPINRMEVEGKSTVYVVKGARIVNKLNDNLMTLDSGASHTMVPGNDGWLTYRPIQNMFAYLGDDTPTPIIGIGTRRVNFGGINRHIRNCYHVPKLVDFLLSVSHVLKDTDDLLVFSKDLVWYYFQNTKTLVEIGRRKGSLYYIDISNQTTPSARLVQNKPPPSRNLKPYLLWHVILNHAQPRTVCRILDHFGIKYDFSSDIVHCPACLQAKSTLRHVGQSKNPAPRNPRFLRMLCCDLIYLPVQGFNSERYGELIIDRDTTTIFAVWFHSKSDAPLIVARELDRICSKYPEFPLLTLFSDHGELDDKRMSDWCTTRRPAVTQVFSPPETQVLNGFVERWMGLISTHAGAHLVTAKLPPKFKRYAIDHAIDVHNSLFPAQPGYIKVGENPPTSFEIRNSFSDDLNRFQPFGCLAAVYIPKKYRTKYVLTVTKALPGIFVGCKGTRIFLVYVYRLNRVVESFHVRFHPFSFPGLSPTADRLHPFTVVNFDEFTEVTRGDLDKDVDLEIDTDEFDNASPAANDVTPTSTSSSATRTVNQDKGYDGIIAVQGDTQG